MLTNSDRTVPVRQRPLTVTVTRSYQLLFEPEWDIRLVHPACPLSAA